METNKVLITGANGFIGTALIKECNNRGLDVYAGVRSTTNLSSLTDLKCEIVTLDYNDINQLAEVMAEHQFEYIIHNAGITKSPSAAEYMTINAGYLRNICAAINIVKPPLKKLLFVSSLASYGPADFQSKGITKSISTPHPVTDYGRSKLAAELYLKSQTEIPWAIVRPTAVYGPNEKDLFQVFNLLNKRLDLQAGTTPPLLTFIYIKDLVRMMTDILISPMTNREYFATDGHVYHGAAFSGFVSQYLGKKAIAVKVPILLLKIIAFLSEKSVRLTGKFPPLNIDKVNELKARNWNCDVSNLKTDLDFTAEYDLPKGIAETIDWYKSNKWL